MRNKLVVGNWKMHGTLAAARDLLAAVQVGCATARNGVEVAVCPPFVHLPLCRELLSSSGVAWGAQNVSEYEQGAYTGEVSAAMLVDLGCRYVIVGHSERRALFAESHAQLAAKLRRALAQDLLPIFCVGETLAEREAGSTARVVAEQLLPALEALAPAELARVVVAYEPVWAIGTGRTATPEQAQEVHAVIRALWRERLGAAAADVLQVLYGGSVKADNARLLFSQPDIDGGLVGGAALDAGQFCAIVNAAEQAWNH